MQLYGCVLQARCKALLVALAIPAILVAAQAPAGAHRITAHGITCVFLMLDAHSHDEVCQGTLMVRYWFNLGF